MTTGRVLILCIILTVSACASYKQMSVAPPPPGQQVAVISTVDVKEFNREAYDHIVDNPFTAGERHEMIVRALADLSNRHWEVIPLEDIHRHALWVAHLESLLPPFETVYTNNPLTRLLFENSGYSVIAPHLVDRDRFEGRKVREAMATGADWESLVPPPVAAFLRGIEGPSRVRLLTARTETPYR